MDPWEDWPGERVGTGLWHFDQILIPVRSLVSLTQISASDFTDADLSSPIGEAVVRQWVKGTAPLTMHCAAGSSLLDTGQPSWPPCSSVG